MKDNRDFCDSLMRASLAASGSYDLAHAQRLASARALLMDLPEEESKPVIDACLNLARNLQVRGAGAVTVFEIVLAVAQLATKESGK